MSQYRIEWITDQLGAGYATLSHEDLALVKENGISAIVNLCGEFCDLYEIQAKEGFKVFYLPVLDECAPDMTDLEKALKWMEGEMAAGRRILVHCRFGMGRTGMLVYAFLLRQGMTLKAVTRKLRRYRANPSCYCQWKLLRQYEKNIKHSTGKKGRAGGKGLLNRL